MDLEDFCVVLLREGRIIFCFVVEEEECFVDDEVVESEISGRGDVVGEVGEVALLEEVNSGVEVGGEKEVGDLGNVILLKKGDCVEFIVDEEENLLGFDDVLVGEEVYSSKIVEKVVELEVDSSVIVAKSGDFEVNSSNIVVKSGKLEVVSSFIVGEVEVNSSNVGEVEVDSSNIAAKSGELEVNSLNVLGEGGEREVISLNVVLVGREGELMGEGKELFVGKLEEKMIRGGELRGELMGDESVEKKNSGEVREVVVMKSLFLFFVSQFFFSLPRYPLSFLPTFFAALLHQQPFFASSFITLPPPPPFPFLSSTPLLFPSFLLAPLSLIQRPPTIHFSTLFSHPTPFFLHLYPLFSPPTSISITIFNLLPPSSHPFLPNKNPFFSPSPPPPFSLLLSSLLLAFLPPFLPHNRKYWGHRESFL